MKLEYGLRNDTQQLAHISEVDRAINDDLCGMLKGSGYISGQELYDLWCTFGETPRVDGLFFNAYGYARRRANFYAWRKRIFLF